MRFAAASVCVVGLALWAGEAWAQRAWPVAQGDVLKQGRAAAPGSITRPVVAWSQKTGGRLQERASLLGDANGDGEPDFLYLVGGAVLARGAQDQLLWDTAPLGLTELIGVVDLDGDGRNEVLARGADFRVLDGRSGRTLWRQEALGLGPLVGGAMILVDADEDELRELLLVDNDNGALALHDFSGGLGDTERWRARDPSYPTQVFRPVIGDFDGDPATLEIAAVNQDRCRASLTRLSDGGLISVSAPLTQGRYCYGLAQAANLDDDPQQELLFTGQNGASDGSVSVSVYDFVSEGLQWQYEYTTNTSASELRSPAGAVADMDGDGAVEVLVSVYNNTEELAGDDGRAAPGIWEALLFSGATGSLVAAVPEARGLGFVDLDQDGRPELLTERLPEGRRAAALYTDMELWTLEEGALSRRWGQGMSRALSLYAAAPSVNPRDLPAVVATLEVGQGDAQVLLMRREEGGGARLVRVSRAGVVTEGALVDSGGVPTVAATQGRVDPWVALRTDRGEVGVYGRALTARARYGFTGYSAGALATERAILFRDSGGALVALSPQDGAALWRREVEGSGGEFVAVDVERDGRYEVAQVGRRLNSDYYLELVSGDGEFLWALELGGQASAPGSLTWGEFDGDGLRDLAFILRNENVELELVTASGSTGLELSRRVSDVAEVNTAPNRQVIPLETGEGPDALLLLHNTTMERLRGEDLSRPGPVFRYPMGTSNSTRSAVVPGPEGAARVWMNFFTMRKALLSVGSGEAVWSVEEEASLLRYASPWAGFSDVSGDGLWDVAVSGRFGDVTVFDQATGAVLRRLCAKGGRVGPLVDAATEESCQEAGTLSSIVVGDVDGDGLEEYVFGGSDGWLYAVTAQSGELLWALFLRYEVGDPLLIDVDGDGAVEVVAPTADSELVVVDQEALEAPGEVREVNLGPGDTILAPEVDVDLVFRGDVFGASWDAAEGALGYRVRLLSENGNAVVPSVEVEGTSHVFVGLSLVQGATYFVEVVALGRGGLSGPRRSDGALVALAQPMILGFQARPDAFAPLDGEETRLTARVTAPAGLRGVSLEISDEDGEVALSEDQDALGSRDYAFDLIWDGEGAAPGLYTARLFAFDAEGAATSDFVLVTVLAPGEEPDMGAEEDAALPDVGDLGEGDLGGEDLGAEDLGEDVVAAPDLPGEVDVEGDDAGVDVATVGRGEDGCCACTTTPGRARDWVGPLWLLAAAAALVWRRRSL
jgi:MYXO-CTERM domain-containing protein